jgi:hypothetical protein
LLVDGTIADLTREDARVAMVEIRGPIEDIQSAIRSIDGVKDVSARVGEDGWAQLEVQIMEKADPRESIFDRVVKNHWSLRRLDVRKRRLDEYFYDLIHKADAALLN